VFNGIWEGLPHAGPDGRGIEVCPGFQGPGICAPGAGIVPCAGVDYPKMGVPLDGKAVDAKVVLPNVPFQTNGDEPIDIVCAGVP
jgi:hypothetical protein